MHFSTKKWGSIFLTEKKANRGGGPRGFGKRPDFFRIFFGTLPLLIGSLIIGRFWVNSLSEKETLGWWYVSSSLSKQQRELMWRAGGRSNVLDCCDKAQLTATPHHFSHHSSFLWIAFQLPLQIYALWVGGSVVTLFWSLIIESL